MPRSKALRPACLAPLAAILAIGGAAAWAAATTRAAPSRPQRIVSSNLCSDQYLLALADRSQIAGLTYNAANPELSAAAAQVGRLRVMSQSAEELLAIGPDLVIGMSGQGSGELVAPPGRHYRMVDLKTAESYADIVAQIRAVAAVVGHANRGEALIARMDRELAALPRPGRGKVAAYYQRRGFLTGTGTLVDDLMHRVGLTNLAAKLGKPELSQMSLEELMAAQPDYLIVESGSDRVEDQGTEMLHHPLLRHIKRLHVPQSWTVCGGPAYVLAARSLTRQLSHEEAARISAR
ncbi:MAG: ABC transporter substrate-binding protein [Sphingomonadales bacterium]|nr:ABC transporter substrate-binding protein [Sphingomonadales bacterium]